LCPLCQNKLLGNNEKKIFPTNIRLKTNIFILKWLLFISITLSIITTFVELYITNTIYYSLFIMGGLFTNYLIVYFILKNKENILKLLGKHGLVLIALSLLWYVATRNTIITNYIIPAFCIFELLFNIIAFIVLKNNYLFNYLNLILLNLLLLLVPIILMLFEYTTFNLLPYICFVFGLIVLIGLIIFYFDEIKTELKKIFNF